MKEGSGTNRGGRFFLACESSAANLAAQSGHVKLRHVAAMRFATAALKLNA
jgi:hypothetical protein